VYSLRRDCAPSALRLRVELLLGLYAVSVFSGGLAHQWCTSSIVSVSSSSSSSGGDNINGSSSSSSRLLAPETAAVLHSFLFQGLWRLCVGSVCAAGWAQGGIACALARRYASSAPPPFGEAPAVLAAAAQGVRVPDAVTGPAVGGLLGGLAGGLAGALGGPSVLGSVVVRAGVGATAVAPSHGVQLVSLFGGLFGGLALGMALGALLCSRKVHARGHGLAQRAFLVAAHPQAEHVWFAWALGWCTLTHWGALSMLRPAMDIFLAGTTQAFPTVHIAAVLVANGACDAALKGSANNGSNGRNGASSISTSSSGDSSKDINKQWGSPLGVGHESIEGDHQTPRLTRSARGLVFLGIFFNMPLLGMYPLVLSHFPHVGEGTLNSGLHCWLAVAWGLQWWSLKQVCLAYGPDRPPMPLAATKKAL